MYKVIITVLVIAKKCDAVIKKMHRHGKRTTRIMHL